jgi:hypothetical protein
MYETGGILLLRGSIYCCLSCLALLFQTKHSFLYLVSNFLKKSLLRFPAEELVLVPGAFDFLSFALN